MSEALEAVFEAQAEPVPTAELTTLRAEVSRLNARLGRPPLGRSERKAFGESYLRTGVVDGLEVKKMTVGNAIEGGVAVPTEIDANIEETLKSLSPLRRVANVVQVGSANYAKLVAVGGVQSGWVSETGTRPETNTPVFQSVTPPIGQLYANPSASQAMLDDAVFDVETWLAQEIAYEFARAEGDAFVRGTGTNQPRGFLNNPTAAIIDGTRPWGTLQHIPTGVAGAFPATGSAAAELLIDLVHALRSPYRQGGTFIMNTTTLARVRKLKDGDGSLLFRPSLLEGTPDTLLGHPIVETDAMPDIADGALAIAFGNFKAGYVIAERAETTVLRDPYTNKPYVNFYAVRRVGGAVVNFEAIKLLRFATT